MESADGLVARRVVGRTLALAAFAVACRTPPARPTVEARDSVRPVVVDAGAPIHARDAGTAVVGPSWAKGTTEERLKALGVGDDSWARPVVYTWTTRVQIDAMRATQVLLATFDRTLAPLAIDKRR